MLDFHLYERIAKVLTDKGYRGELATLIQRAFGERPVDLEISQRPEESKGFQVEPKRWIVERP
ncbi:hypothetical protein H6F90_05420 [Trichocoleus sp. FACHB-591]|uniref:hypothetical protein n=1 Tax=Trichocoleus sp. FACHB-591 TaxID=2692872 RepID=UPI0016870D24|nr:hypothetical protein [Trichocoleus sp. FACHB-591]MBD2094590.1 hypothetical protein [Trichocoleus sp. FACHB-591]